MFYFMSVHSKAISHTHTYTHTHTHTKREGKKVDWPQTGIVVEATWFVSGGIAATALSRDLVHIHRFDTRHAAAKRHKCYCSQDSSSILAHPYKNHKEIHKVWTSNIKTEPGTLYRIQI